jgi:periplasmic protein TonB
MSTYRMIVPDGATLHSSPQLATVSASHGSAPGNLFLEAMLEMPTTNGQKARNPAKMAVSIVIHAVLIALLLIVPVYFASNTLSLQKYEPTYVFTPPKITLRAAAPAAAAKALQAMTRTPEIAQPTFVAPRSIPKEVTAASNNNVAAPNLDAMGGVPGGVPGGVLGGVLGGTGAIPGPPVPKNGNGIVRVGGNVRPPELIQRISPEYPAVARAGHVQGTVVIDAVIDASGNVVSEHAVSGPDLLVAAALSAVEQWKYQPTYLNGKPVQLAMEVTVSFHLG